MWTNTLTENEVIATLAAEERLRGVDWAKPLLDCTSSMTDRVRVGLNDKAAYRANPVKPDEMSFFFEIRFADALAEAGMTASYEYSAGVGRSTVDFRVESNPPWLVELVSLRESQAFKEASWATPQCQGYFLSTNPNRPDQSVEGETRNAQRRIGMKVANREGRPVKFPVPNDHLHMVIVDARGYMGDGKGLIDDFRQMVLGPDAVQPHFIQYWTDTETGQRGPIRGLFEQKCQLPASRVARERLHYIGLVCEKDFIPTELLDRIVYLPNLALFADEADAQRKFSGWPLGPSARSIV